MPPDGFTMPHIIIKAWPGKTQAQKQQLADAITRSVMEHFHYGEESVSIAFEEIPRSDGSGMSISPTSSGDMKSC